MARRHQIEVLFLHALPFGGAMWRRQREALPNASLAPTLYSLGDSLEAWAAKLLSLATGERLIVVGCSVGGSCALELARAAPDRIAALVLIGTKARHRPDPALRALALETLQQQGLEEAWRIFWEPLFARSADRRLVDDAKRMALRQAARDVARGVTAFHSRASRDDVLSTFPGPVIVITGDEDRAPGPATCAAQADRAPHGQLHVIPGCGHYMPLERPEALNALLRDVIAKA